MLFSLIEKLRIAIFPLSVKYFLYFILVIILHEEFLLTFKDADIK